MHRACRVTVRVSASSYMQVVHRSQPLKVMYYYIIIKFDTCTVLGLSALSLGMMDQV